MWSALLRKELRQVLPWALLAYSIGGLSFVLLLFFAPDTLSWAEATALFEPVSGRVWNGTLLLFAVSFAYAGFPREYDDQTSHFLLSLPVTRTRLFLAKVGASALLLVGWVLLSELQRGVASVANPGSFDGHNFRLGWAFANTLLGVWVACINLGYATFLAAFRRFGLLLGLLVWTGLALLADKRPAYRQLSPLELMHVEFFNSRPLLPYKALFGHSIVALALSALAGFMWLGPAESFAAGLSRFLAKTWVRWTFALCAFTSICTVMVLAYGPSDDTDEEFGSPAELSGPEEQLDTRRFHFRFRAPLRTRVERLAKSADGMHDSVSEMLGAPAGEPIQVNLLKPSQFHAGSATLNAIRMQASALYDDALFAQTLAHEISHVVALRVSERRLQASADTLRFFEEGLAEHTALTLVPTPARADPLWLEAALLRQREHVGIAELSHLKEFVRRFGEPSIYPLGYTWVRALLAICGDSAPRRVLAALKSSELPNELRGEALIHSALQLARCDASQVHSEWGRSLDAVSSERRTELELVPELIGGLTKNADGDVVVRAELRGNPLPEALYRLNVRGSSEDGLDSQATVGSELDADGHLEFFVPEDYVTDAGVDFQFAVAWQRDGLSFQHAQEWRHGRASP
ncbi:MAG: ABC transporter permease [Myxococcota bacterium]